MSGAVANGAHVLLLSPLGLDSTCWRYVDPGAGKTVVIPDLPGHGARKDEPVPLFDSIVDEIAQIAGGPFHVVGVAMGGIIAQHLVLHSSSTVQSLVLACTRAQSDPSVMDARAEKVERVGAPAIAAELVANEFSARCAGDAMCRQRMEFARQQMSRMDSAVLAHYWRALSSHDVLDRLHEITVPVTLVAGIWDSFRPTQRLRPLSSRLPLSRSAILECAHMPHIESPEAFGELLKDHLDWALAAPEADND